MKKYVFVLVLYMSWSIHSFAAETSQYFLARPTVSRTHISAVLEELREAGLVVPPHMQLPSQVQLYIKDSGDSNATFVDGCGGIHLIYKLKVLTPGISESTQVSSAIAFNLHEFGHAVASRNLAQRSPLWAEYRKLGCQVEKIYRYKTPDLRMRNRFDDLRDALKAYDEFYADVFSVVTLGDGEAMWKSIKTLHNWSPDLVRRNFNILVPLENYMSADPYEQLEPTRGWLGKRFGGFGNLSLEQKQNIIGGVNEAISGCLAFERPGEKDRKRVVDMNRCLIANMKRSFALP